MLELAECVGFIDTIRNSIKGPAQKYDPELQRSVFLRDHKACRHCGVTFTDEALHLICHHADYNIRNSNPDNLVSECHMCHCIQNLGMVTMQHEGHMHFVYVPEISQEELNAVSWGIAHKVLKHKNSHDCQEESQLIKAILERVCAFPKGYLSEPAKFCGSTHEELLFSIQHNIYLLQKILLQMRKVGNPLFQNRTKWLSGARIFFEPRDAAELFGGIAADIDENCYQSMLQPAMEKARKLFA